MPVPTNVRVESTAPTTAILRWSYSGAATLGVYRSEDGSSYSLITSPLLATDVREYTDTERSPQTRYWYKISDDSGSTFSSVVSVVTQVDPTRLVNKTPLSLADATDLEDLKQQLTAREQNQTPLDPCVVCPENGSLVFDCSFGCIKFEAVATENINSISIVGCPPLECPDIHIIIPPDETREICGWPIACGHEGDECYDAPILGGEDGRTLDQEGYVYNGYGRRGRRGPRSCPCDPDGANTLQMVCCSEDCAIDCQDNPSISLKACGGVAPYTWTVTGDIEVVPEQGSSVVARFNPETYGNDNPTSGAAYERAGVRLNVGNGGACAAGGGDFATIGQAARKELLMCNGTVTTGPLWANCSGSISFSSPNGVCSSNGQHYLAGLQVHINTSNCGSQSHDIGVGANQDFFNDARLDVRTAEQIENGCNPLPCHEADTAATVTVTDAAGVSVTLVLGT